MNDKSPMDQFSAHLDRGWDLANRGDLFGAQVSAEKSLEIDAQSAEAHNLLGYVQAMQGNPEEALEHYRQAIALDDGYVEAYLNAAEVLMHPLRDFKSAATMADEALTFAEDAEEVADALLVKFDVHMHLADRDTAAKIAARLPNGPFESARLDLMVGRARLEIGDEKSGELLIANALEREPDNSDGHYYLAMINETKGKHIEAIREFLKVRDLDARMGATYWTVSAEIFEQRIADALKRLAEPMAAVLQGSLVIVSDAPGVEMVADGIDPRAGVMLDESTKQETPPRIGRAFFYQRNLERAAGSLSYLEEEIVRGLEQEIAAIFPDLAAPAPVVK